MKKRILKSLLVIAVTLAVGGYASYAAFIASAVTISNNTVMTGTAESKLCNSDGTDNWKNAINPSFVVSSLIPGDEQELTNGTEGVFLGNDAGNLTAVHSTKCKSYGDAAGSSDVSMQFVPQLLNVDCHGNPTLKDQVMLSFDMGDGSYSTYYSLNEWAVNPNVFGPTYAPDDGHRIHIKTKLDLAATLQGQTCNFDVTFTGQQI